MFFEALCIVGKLEEVCSFLHWANFSAAVWALAVNELGFSKEAFARHAVEAFVFALIDVALIIKLLEDLGNLFLVHWVRCSDELVVGCVETVPVIPDLSCSFVYKLLRCDTSCFSLFLNLLAVFVSTCLEVNIIALFTSETCDSVGKNDFVGVADVWAAGCVSNSCGNIIRSTLFVFHDIIFLSCFDIFDVYF